MKNLLLAVLMTLTMVACTGGGGGGSTYTHGDAADDFVDNLYADSAGTFDSYVAKAYTIDGYGSFIVIKEFGGSYYALDISGYSNYMDAETYFYSYSGDARTVYDNYDGTYGDIYGNLFEKTSSSPKDLAKVAAIAEVSQINKRAEFLNAEFALSMERSKEVARLTTHWKKASLKGMTSAEHNSFSTELLGFSITDAKNSVQNEGQSGIDSLVNAAADANGITPEHASKLMTKIFGL